MYYEYAEPIHKIVSHRILATNRGEKEGILKVGLQVEEEPILSYLERQLINNPASPATMFVRNAYQDSYKRFIQPAIEVFFCFCIDIFIGQLTKPLGKRL